MGCFVGYLILLVRHRTFLGFFLHLMQFTVFTGASNAIDLPVTVILVNDLSAEFGDRLSTHAFHMSRFTVPNSESSFTPSRILHSPRPTVFNGG